MDPGITRIMLAGEVRSLYEAAGQRCAAVEAAAAAGRRARDESWAAVEALWAAAKESGAGSVPQPALAAALAPPAAANRASDVAVIRWLRARPAMWGETRARHLRRGFGGFDSFVAKLLGDDA